MRTTFTDTSTASRSFCLRRKGTTALIVGSALVVLLLTGNMATWFATPSLTRTDAAYRQPPQWLLFQRLLYHPSVPVEPFDEQFQVTSTPRFTAVALRPYRYAVHINHPNGTVRYQLLTAPPGMEIDETGLITWVPDMTHANGRGHEVVIVAADANGRATQQSLSVIVSERTHPLGTDEAGRDMLAALVLGTRWAVLPGLLTAAVSLLLGVFFGAMAGYYAGWWNATLSYVMPLTEAFPALVLLFLATVISGYALHPVMVVLGLILFPGVARGVRDQVADLKAHQFVEAAQELGLRDAEVLWKDIVWHNTRSFLIGRFFYALALSVAVEVTLSYLRIGVQPPVVSWGNMILAGRGLIESHHYALAFFPAVATLLAVAGYTLLGSALTRQVRVKGT